MPLQGLLFQRKILSFFVSERFVNQIGGSQCANSANSTNPCLVIVSAVDVRIAEGRWRQKSPRKPQFVGITICCSSLFSEAILWSGPDNCTLYPVLERIGFSKIVPFYNRRIRTNCRNFDNNATPRQSDLERPGHL
jgi:hypothetical protein